MDTKKLYEHQKKLSEELKRKVSSIGYGFLHAQERTGKTGVLLCVAESSKVEEVLIISTKKALKGIAEQIEFFKCKKKYTLINYQSLHKVEQKAYKVVILDEYHTAVCGYPKKSETLKKLLVFTKGAYIIYCSATPFSETLAQTYHPLLLSSFSPFKEFKNFYRWFDVFGIPEYIKINGIMIKQYKKVKDDLILPHIKRAEVVATRKDIGFKYEPEDILHTVELKEETKRLIRQAQKDKIIFDELLESTMAEATAIHQICGGTFKDSVIGDEKLQYIKENFSNDVYIMAHFKKEQEMLLEHFSNVLSSTAHAEGVDLHKVDELVIYSMGFSTSKYTQRRCRQANKNREKPIKVHYLLTNFDKKVYEQVAIKNKNFNGRTYERSYY
jgi:hypothetical protein